MRHLTKATASRWTALVVAASMVMPALAGCGSKQDNTAASGGGAMAPANAPTPAPVQQHQGLTGKQKVVLLAGAALLYYLYRRDVANNNKAASTTGSNGRPQLYREEKGPNKGAIYYRDPKNPQHVIWLQAPNQPIAVPQDQVQQYAPDFQQYQGRPAPPTPQGATTVPATQYDASLAGGPGGPPGPGG